LAYLRLRLRNSYRHFDRYPARLPRVVLRLTNDLLKRPRTLEKVRPETPSVSGGRGVDFISSANYHSPVTHSVPAVANNPSFPKSVNGKIATSSHRTSFGHSTAMPSRGPPPPSGSGPPARSRLCARGMVNV
jgi:hypothetical protein